MHPSDILRRLTFGVKKTVKAKKADTDRQNGENEQRLRVVPAEVRKVLNDEKNIEESTMKNDDLSSGEEDTLELLRGSKLVAASEVSKRKRKMKAKGSGEGRKAEMIARLRRVNRMYAWGEEIPEPILEWNDIDGMSDTLKFNLQKDDITEPTPIQMQAIPMMLQRRNVLASAPTGSGKTMAFSIPIVLDVLENREKTVEGAKKRKKKEVNEMRDKMHAIVLEPTRELAKQTHRWLLKLTEGIDVNCALLGEEELSGRVDILVCTPNRLVHRISSIDVSSLRWLVVDESDRLFDAVEGGDRCFRSQLAIIYKAVENENVRRAFFSATFSYQVEEWCKENLDRVAMLCIGERNSANSSVTQELVFTGSEQGKLVALRDLLTRQFTPPAIVFVQSKERARQLMSSISSMATTVPVSMVSSEKSEKEREIALESFRSGRSWVLVCTELLGRGLDLPAVNLVVNFDLPTSIVSYIHRVGRTGRAGRVGRAITYFTESDMALVRPIAVVISQAGFEVPPYTLLLKAPNKNDKKRAMKHAPKRKSIGRMKRKKREGGEEGKGEDKDREKRDKGMGGKKDKTNIKKKRKTRETAI